MKPTRRTHLPAIREERRPPTRDEILAARGNTVPDVIGPGLRVLFSGINPGLYSGAVHHHFARLSFKIG